MPETESHAAHRRTAVLAALTLVGAIAVLYLLRQVLSTVVGVIQLFVIAFLIALALQPAVTWLTRRRVPRPLAVLGPLLLVLVALAVLGVIFIPPAARQAGELAKNLPAYGEDLRYRAVELAHRYPSLNWLEARLQRMDLSAELGARAGLILRWASAWAGPIAAGVAGGVVSVVLTAFAVIFMLMYPERLRDGILGLFPDRCSAKARHVIGLMVARLRAWIQGIVILMVAVGVLTYIGLVIAGVPYAALFAAIAGLLEIVPTVGPVIAAVPPVLVGLARDPMLALWVVIIFLLVQQAENNLLVPFVMSRQLDLHPVSVLFGFLVMASLFGLFGAIIAVPTVACLKVLYDELYTPWAHPKNEQQEGA